MDELEKLKIENLKLRETISSIDDSARMLVRRDLELHSANEKMKSLDKQKSEFVSIAAHQLRTPLSGIKWSQQMLLDGDLGALSSEQRTLLTQAQESVNNLVRLINDLLYAHHLELGNINSKLQVIDLAKVFTEIISDLGKITQEKNITVQLQVDAQVPQIQTTSDKIKELFLNLFDNAIKYTNANGKISVSIKNNNGVTVSIADTGIGIPNTFKKEVFGRFFRAENAKKVIADGTGLGLYITKKLADAAGATISFESTEGVGTTFHVTFPVSQSVVSVTN